MRTYDVAVTALAIGAPIKWTDNAITQHVLDGVIGARRGVTRRLSHAALLALFVARELHAEAGLGVGDALVMAGRLLDAAPESVPVSGHVRVTLDRPAVERRLNERLREALESAPAPRRGRPPRRPSRGDGQRT